MACSNPSLAPQISLETRDVFIECTATDLTKAKVVLNTVCAMFAEYCSTPYVVEPVEVIDSFGESHGERQCDC
jgi:phenylalanyl-tRNA synthetase beta chain